MSPLGFLLLHGDSGQSFSRWHWIFIKRRISRWSFSGWGFGGWSSSISGRSIGIRKIG